MARLTRRITLSALGLALALAVGLPGEAKAQDYFSTSFDFWCSRSDRVVVPGTPARRAPPIPIAVDGICFGIGAGAASLNAPTTSFFALQDPVTLARRNLSLHSDYTDVGFFIDGSVTFGSLPNPVSPANPGSLTVGGSFFSASQRTFIPLVDPGTNRLLVFGTGVDPSGPGFNVAPGLGDFNDATDYFYSRHVDQLSFFTQYNMPIARVGSVDVAALVRLGYTHTNIDERQSARLANVPLDIRNSVDLSVNTFTPGAGAQFLLPITSNVALHAYGWAGVAISHGSGNETFAFNGLFNGDQHNDVSGSHVGFAGEVGGGFVFQVNNRNAISATVSFATSDSHPIVERSGEANQRSKYRVENADNLGTRVKFHREFDPLPR
jgi:hypothetical protein